MEQNQPIPTPVQDDEFKKRRAQKNRMVVSLVLGGVVLIWAVTMLKFNPDAFRNVVGIKAETVTGNPQSQQGGKDAQ